MELSTNSEFYGRLCATMKWAGETYVTGRWCETGQTHGKHLDEVTMLRDRALIVPNDDALTRMSQTSLTARLGEHGPSHLGR